MNALDGLKILGAYLVGAAMALVVVGRFDRQPLAGPYAGMSVMVLGSGAIAASSMIGRTKRPNEPVLFGVTVLAVLGVTAVFTIHASLGWKNGWANPLAFALVNAVLLPVAQAHGERRRTMPGAVLDR
jgi:hypothetical protein